MNTGMSNARRRLLALANLPKYRDGGPVRGPGTGTSDEVLDEVRPGSYIVPADTTEKVGPRTLRDVARNLMPEDEGGKRIPVRLSNGEYKLSPEQVHAIGVRALDQMKNATHKPAGAAPRLSARDRLLRLADGGMVNEVTREGNSYSGGNVGGNISINGASAGGTVSSVPSAAPAPAAPAVPAPEPASSANAAAPAAPQPGAPTAAAATTQSAAAGTPAVGQQAAPQGWAERNAQRSLEVTASSIKPSRERDAAQAQLSSMTPPGGGRMNAFNDPRSTTNGANPYAAGNTAKLAGLGASIGSRGVVELGRPAAPQPATARNSFGDAAAATTNPGVTQLGVHTAFSRPGYADGGVVGEERSQPGPPPNIYPQASPAGAARTAAGIATEAFPNTTRAVQGAMDDARTAYREGGFGAALGQSARVAGKPLIGLADDVMSSAARAIDPAAQALKTFVTGDATPIGQERGATASPSAAAPRPAAPTTTVPENPTDQRLAAGTQAPLAGAAASPLAGNTSVPGVYRSGNSYASTPEAAEAGAVPRGMQSVQNMAAADNLASASMDNVRARLLAIGNDAPAQEQATPVTRHSGNDWAARKELENARTAASSITNNPRWAGKNADNSVAMQEYRAVLSNDIAQRQAQPGLEQEGQRQRGLSARARLLQIGENARANLSAQRADDANRIAAGRLAIEQNAAGFQNRAAQRMENAQVAYEQASTPAQRISARDRLLALAGKAHDDQWKAVALQGGTDAMGNKTESILGAVNERTGEMRRMDSGKATPPAKDALVKGQVYQTARGPAVWDGTQFRAQ
ncbi:hypothetical protein [Paracidovorax anthurii]|uniref:Uncharacterized protein n=1 Tax=Paracidovorax anthurii TaxID=78229 RepID=A0A328ZK66_9BURK|nr:hypothetical protein [Paracidovorax anthurii]RAR85032.1 hypothetical protein AX018_1008125 [Paracidovorax anthurii]